MKASDAASRHDSVDETIAETLWYRRSVRSRRSLKSDFIGLAGITLWCSSEVRTPAFGRSCFLRAENFVHRETDDVFRRRSSEHVVLRICVPKTVHGFDRGTDAPAWRAVCDICRALLLNRLSKRA